MLMKKIVVLSNTAFSIEKFRLHYLKRLSGYAIDIYTPDPKIKINSNLKNIRSYKFFTKNIIQELFTINKIINKNNNATFLVFSFKYQFLLGLIRLIKSFKIVCVIAGKGSYFYKKRITTVIFKPLIKFIFSKFDKIICINPYDKKFFYKYLAIKIDLIPTEGVGYSSIKSKTNNQKNFVFFARLIKEKGLFEFLQIAKIFKEKYKNLNFYICGPSNKKYIGQSNSYFKKEFNFDKKYVTYLGYKKNYKNTFLKMDCLISPSYTEGAGTSVMEAMMSGLFVVAYKNNGHNYILKNTGNIICDQNISALKKSVETYLEMDKKKLNLISIKSKKKIYRNFSSIIVSTSISKLIN